VVRILFIVDHNNLPMVTTLKAGSSLDRRVGCIKHLV
jgi:hypothetical protein